MKITFIGGGVMAEAILGGILDGGVAKADEIRFGEPVAERRTVLAETYGVAADADNLAVIEGADIVVLAMKPQHLATAMDGIKSGLRGDQAVLSIVAGATLETLSKGLRHRAVVRVMPNTPAQIREGMTVWTATDQVNDEQKADSQRIVASFGEEIYVEDEKYIDMVTALSASGPAYVFLFVEALIDAGGLHGAAASDGEEARSPDGHRERQVRSGDGNAPGGAKGHGIVACGRDGRGADVV